MMKMSGGKVKLNGKVIGEVVEVNSHYPAVMHSLNGEPVPHRAIEAQEVTFTVRLLKVNQKILSKIFPKQEGTNEKRKGNRSRRHRRSR